LADEQPWRGHQGQFIGDQGLPLVGHLLFSAEQELLAGDEWPWLADGELFIGDKRQSLRRKTAFHRRTKALYRR
jgi:hypothetical protein